MALPREVINLHVGKAGVEVGRACWELFGVEQGIAEDGGLSREVDMATGWTTFYREIEENRYIPRAIFTDLEPRYIDKMRVDRYKDLWENGQLLSGTDDAACLYARGYYTNGKDHLDKTADALRRQVELADNPQGFLSFHSLGGGTGSGFSSLIMERITGDSPKIPLLEISVLPTPEVSPYFVEPYNIVLATHTKLEFTNTACTFLLDNKSLHKICKSKLEIDNPSYVDMNHVASHVVSSITAGMRYPEDRLVTVNDVTDLDLTPFPRIHFPIVSYTPFLSVEKSHHAVPAVQDLTDAMFCPENQLVYCDGNQGKYITCSLLYRGQHVQVEDVNKSVDGLKERLLCFTDWSPGEGKIAVHKHPLKTVDNDCMGKTNHSVLLLANSTAVKSTWMNIGERFDLLFSKRAYFHWFLQEGMDEQEFAESRECLASLINDYDEIEELSNSKNGR